MSVPEQEKHQQMDIHPPTDLAVPSRGSMLKALPKQRLGSSGSATDPSGRTKCPLNHCAYERVKRFPFSPG